MPVLPLLSKRKEYDTKENFLRHIKYVMEDPDTVECRKIIKE